MFNRLRPKSDRKQNIEMRIITLLAMPLLPVLVCVRTLASGPADDQTSKPAPTKTTATAPLENRFRDTVRPFVDTYCVGCHGKENPKGDLDLSVFATADSVAKDLAQWEVVLEQLKSGTMPPAKAKQHPNDEMRRGIVDWIQAIRKLEAKRNAGDPGRVLARRLSNAEYDYTIRDLSGVDLRPTREFPVDPANLGWIRQLGGIADDVAGPCEKVSRSREVCRRPSRSQAAGVCVCTAPGDRRHRPRQILRTSNHRFLQAAADRLRRLLPGGLAIPAPAGTRPSRCVVDRGRHPRRDQRQVSDHGLVVADANRPKRWDRSPRCS